MKQKRVLAPLGFLIQLSCVSATADNIAILDYLSDAQWALTGCPDPASPIISPELMTMLQSERYEVRDRAKTAIVGSLQDALRRHRVQIYCVLGKQLVHLRQLQRRGADLELVRRIDQIADELRRSVDSYSRSNSILGHLSGWKSYADGPTGAAFTTAMYERAGCRITGVYCEQYEISGGLARFSCNVSSDNCLFCSNRVDWEGKISGAAPGYVTDPSKCECDRDFYSPVVVRDSFEGQGFRTTICKLDGDPPPQPLGASAPCLPERGLESGSG